MTSQSPYVAIIMTAEDCPPCRNLKQNGTISQIQTSLNSMGLTPVLFSKKSKNDPISSLGEKYPSGLDGHLSWTPTIAIVPRSQFSKNKVVTEVEVYNQGSWNSASGTLAVKQPISPYDAVSVTKWAKEVLANGIKYVSPTGAMAGAAVVGSSSGLGGGASSKVPIGGANMCTVHKVKSSGNNNRKFW